MRLGVGGETQYMQALGSGGREESSTRLYDIA